VVNPKVDNVPENLYCAGNCVDEIGGVLALSYDNARVVKYGWNAAKTAPILNNKELDFVKSKDGVWLDLFVENPSLTKGFQCAWNENILCPWEYKSRNNIVYYHWSSNGDSWNQYSYLEKNGQPITFNKPLIVEYQAPSADRLPVGVDPVYAGRKVRFEVPGAGQMWFPGRCLDRSTRQQVADCGRAGTEWVHDLYVPFDPLLGRVNVVDFETGVTSSQQYLVKWIMRGVLFARKDEQVCSGLSLPTASNSQLPTQQGWRNLQSSIPWNPGNGFDGEPIFIDGVRQ